MGAALLLPGCGEVGPATKAAPIRLVELRSGVEVYWPDGTPAEPPRKLPPTAAGRGAKGGLLRRVTMSA